MAAKSPKDTIAELQALVVAYVKQETIEPLVGLGRYLAFGLLGAFGWGIGVVFCSVGALRALQSETGTTFGGNWSWAPPLIVVVGLLFLAAMVWKMRRRLETRKDLS